MHGPLIMRPIRERCFRGILGWFVPFCIILRRPFIVSLTKTRPFGGIRRGFFLCLLFGQECCKYSSCKILPIYPFPCSILCSLIFRRCLLLMIKSFETHIKYVVIIYLIPLDYLTFNVAVFSTRHLAL